MTYSGNPSLSPDVRQRILGTFEQTLQLAGEGSRQEALLGCDFVLRMDPQFEPARVLQERLKSSAGPVRVDDLLGAGGGSALPEPDDPFGSLDGLSLDLPDLPILGGAEDGGGLRAEFQALLDQRRFQELLTAAERERPAVTADPELQRIVAAGQERMEAEPYLMKFLLSARQALQTGNAAEVARLLDKAKSLDPSHPEIAELERIGRAPAAPPPPEPVQIPSPFPAAAMPSATLAFGGSGDSESERRIRELLNEGQAALDKGDPQGAIDAWSRIFLIDIDHQEAARRIEGARRVKAENERQVEEVFHDGLARLETGDAASARRSFQRVLELQPGHFAAREYLQQIDSGNVPTPRPGSLRELPAIPPDLPLPGDLDASGKLREEILVPPEPPRGTGRTAERRTAAKAPAARAGGEGRARRTFLIVGGAVLVLALVAGWFFLQNRDSVFPNSQTDDEASVAPLPGSDPIARAERLHKAGKTDLAVSQLRRLPETDPNYARAQKLIAEWDGTTVTAVSGSGAPAGAPAAVPVPPAVPESPESAQRRQALLAAARAAYGERSYLKAMTRLEQAAALGQLEGDDARLLEDAKRKLVPIAQEIDLFRQHEWEFILPKLWRMRDENPDDRDINQLIVDCYYNLGVRDLQRADAMKAAEKFQEALNLRPEDPLLRRHLLFAQTYEQRQKDLLYRIYVKYLPYR
jgi:tetratricopeptide (TPR) repeat protein